MKSSSAWQHGVLPFDGGSAGMGSELKAAAPGVGGGEEEQGECWETRRGTCNGMGSRYLARGILIRERRDQRKSCLGKLSFFLMQSTLPEINSGWRYQMVFSMMQQNVMMKYSSSGALFHHSVYL